MSLENNFNITFTALLSLREKQIQQHYRPIIGIHKWFARRPGTLFRSLLLSEFSDEAINESYWKSHEIHGVIADPFMGGGTCIYEANRLGFNVIGADINPMSYWIVRQSLAPINIDNFSRAAETVIEQTEKRIKEYYKTRCTCCGQAATVKYFLWVKTEVCPNCSTVNDLFPGYVVAMAGRHPRYVVSCSQCGNLNEYEQLPTLENVQACKHCGSPVHAEGIAHRQSIKCHNCKVEYSYPAKDSQIPPNHKMWAIEYHCSFCKPNHKGRFFKKPDDSDIKQYENARQEFQNLKASLPIPQNEIPVGDETTRLRRWGYRYYYEMFSERQLLGLGLLLKNIENICESEIRHALLTVFSDFLRYQNMLCRYATDALKCQDIFSVHGFPVGLIQCENNLLGISGIGAGGYRHFVKKYLRAKEYCKQPFEIQKINGKKKTIPISGETIGANFTSDGFSHGHNFAFIQAVSATDVVLPPASIDGVFTDPPYFDNVQYAELMDFCYSWLRLSLCKEINFFHSVTTRAQNELTGNKTLGRDISSFTLGLSRIFCHYAKALKPSAPFVFTYHHNSLEAYVPLVVAILDAQLICTATFPAPAEMGASLHISGTASSILDTIFVCRLNAAPSSINDVREQLYRDKDALLEASIKMTKGDIQCLKAGHVARVTINRLSLDWKPDLPLEERMTAARNCLTLIFSELDFDSE